MRKTSIKNQFDTFADWLGSYIDILVKVNSSPNLTKEDRGEIYESFVLKICTQWHILCEELLIACLNRDVSFYATSRDMKFPKHLTHDVCDCLINGLSYFDFRSTRDLQYKAKSILASRFNIFKAIQPTDGNKIDDFFIIRNYVAHNSRKAGDALEKIYKNRYRLKRWSEPAPFLMTLVGQKPKHSRMHIFISAFVSAARDMEAHALNVGLIKHK